MQSLQVLNVLVVEDDEDDFILICDYFKNIAAWKFEIKWVQRYNDRYIGQGRCGAMTTKLHRAFRDRVRAETAREIAA